MHSGGIRVPDDKPRDIKHPLVDEYYKLCCNLGWSIQQRLYGFNRSSYYKWILNLCPPSKANEDRLREFIRIHT